MRNLAELDTDIDSVKNQVLSQRVNHYLYKPTYFNYYLKKDSLIMPEEVYRQKLLRDSLARVPYMERSRKDSAKAILNARPDSILRTEKRTQVTTALKKPTLDNKRRTQVRPKLSATLKPRNLAMDSAQRAKTDSILRAPVNRDIVQGATNAARQVKSQVMNANLTIDNYEKELIIFEIQWHKILASSFACIAMFLIGAPLGAIIKKGGLGVPFLVSIFFFIIYYVITMQGEKLAKQDTVSVALGVWAADIILFIIGLVFLRQARIDARLFEADFYSVVMDKVKKWLAARRHPHPKIA
jgi:lipopolysaccharide export system permease protein